jgi:hypothetical protein
VGTKKASTEDSTSRELQVWTALVGAAGRTGGTCRSEALGLVENAQAVTAALVQGVGAEGCGELGGAA